MVGKASRLDSADACWGDTDDVGIDGVKFALLLRLTLEEIVSSCLG